MPAAMDASILSGVLDVAIGECPDLISFETAGAVSRSLQAIVVGVPMGEQS
jgi:hypothetical protein